MLFSKNMSDFEKLIFAESYIKKLKIALRKYEKNDEVYRENIKNIIKDFKEVCPKFGKLTAYKVQMKALEEKLRKVNFGNDKLEYKNYVLRQKVRKLQEEVENLKSGKDL